MGAKLAWGRSTIEGGLALRGHGGMWVRRRRTRQMAQWRRSSDAWGRKITRPNDHENDSAKIYMTTSNSL